ncbi:MAG: hypothetical protein ABJV04_14100 [Aliiglaciecola sp.]|uniref:hypothetical protein n=1 Tax=Aliiglaciecola sp. TaxID=1872441 RepID=UPI003299CFDD
MSVLGAYNILKDEYSVVGTLNNLSLAMHSLADKASFHDEYKVSKLNVTSERPKQTEVEQSDLDVIAEVNKLDVKLYELVKENSA